MTREIKTLRCLFPEPQPPRCRNFIKENVKSLRRMEQLCHIDDKCSKDTNALVMRNTKINHKPVKNNVTIRNESTPESSIENGIDNLFIQKSYKDRKTSAQSFSNQKPTIKRHVRTSLNGCISKKTHAQKDQFPNKIECNQKLKVHTNSHTKVNCDSTNKIHTFTKSQGVQTVAEQDMENLYMEGTIKYPSEKSKSVPQLESHGLENDSQQLLGCDKSEATGNLEYQRLGDLKQLKLSKDKVKLTTQFSSSAPPSSYRAGVIPKYIKERKEELEREKRDKTAAKQTDNLSGHVPLPDVERIETLNVLKKNHQEFINELNMLPIRTDTLRSQRRKMEIEKKLEKLEEAIKVFSRPKVFVQIDS